MKTSRGRAFSSFRGVWPWKRRRHQAGDPRETKAPLPRRAAANVSWNNRWRWQSHGWHLRPLVLLQDRMGQRSACEAHRMKTVFDWLGKNSSYSNWLHKYLGWIFSESRFYDKTRHFLKLTWNWVIESPSPEQILVEMNAKNASS